jgi:hypothetical protein
MKPDIIEFVTDPQLLGLSLSSAQRTALKAFYGLPLSPEEKACWIQCTGRTAYPGRPFREGTFLCGARAGKDSRIATPVLAYEATYGDHERALGKGEFGILSLVAQDQRETRIAFSYLKDAFTRSSLLASKVDDIGASEIKLTNRLSALCFPCTQSSLRGWSNPVGAMSEIAFYRLEGQSDSDVEIQASIRRGMLSFPNPKLIKISTPYLKSGLLYQDFKRYYGQESPDVLVWRASSLFMNPSLKAERLAQERTLDESRYFREYEAQFLEDLDTMFPVALVERLIVPHRYELAPREGIAYRATCDPMGGSTNPNADTFTLTIMHAEGSGDQQRLVQDVLKGWKGADLQGIVKEIAALLRRYRISEVFGDRYAGAWVRQAFAREGMQYRDVEWTKSDAYLESEPFFTQQRIDLVDHPTLLRELTMLERRPRAQGRTLVDRPHGGHDDYANVTCLAVAFLAKQGRPMPWAFTSGGITVSMADPVEPTVVGRVMEQAADLSMRAVDAVRSAGQTMITAAFTPTTEPVAHERTLQEIANTRRSRRSLDEQARLDRWQQQQPQPQTDVEASIRRDGCWWPGDALPTADLIAQKFQRWR